MISAYYLKDYTLIDNKKNIGGQFNSKFTIGPRFIHYNKEFEALLKELKIKYTIKTARVKYFYRGHLCDTLTEQMKKEYAIKTRNSKDAKSFMNDKHKNFKYLDFDMNKFVNKIFKKLKNRFIDSNVKRIDTKNKIIILNNSRKLRYDKLISTIHYKIFCRLVEIPYLLKNKNIYVYWCNYNKELIKKNKKAYNSDFIYIIDRKDVVNRVSYTKKYVVVETVKPIYFVNNECIKYLKLEDYKLSSRNRIKKFKDIYYLGRYSNMKNSNRIDNIFEEIKNVK